MTDEERRQLAELFREDDLLRAEHEQWLARREATREAPMRKSNAATEQNAQASAAPPDTGPASSTETDAELTETDKKNLEGWNAWLRAHIAIERQSIREELEGTLIEIIVELRAERDAEIKKAVAERDAEIAHLRGQVEVLTHMFAGKSTDTNVVDLPNWRPRDVA